MVGSSTYERTENEKEVIGRFLSDYFPDSYPESGHVFIDREISEAEQSEIDGLVADVDDLFNGFKGLLGLALDFIMVAERISQVDGQLADFEGDLDRSDIFDRYDQAATKATLTLRAGGERFGIRSVHEEIIDLFRDDLHRTNFPSAAPHTTGEWERFDEMLVSSFRLSRPGRWEAAQQLFDIGLERLEARSFLSRDPPFPIRSRLIPLYPGQSSKDSGRWLGQHNQSQLMTPT